MEGVFESVSRLAPIPTLGYLIALVLVLGFVLLLVRMVLRSGHASLDLDLRRGRVRIVRRPADDEDS